MQPPSDSARALFDKEMDMRHITRPLPRFLLFTVGQNNMATSCATRSCMKCVEGRIPDLFFRPPH